MKLLKGQVYVAIICVVLGLMLAYQFKAVKNINSAATESRVEDIQKQLKGVQKEKEDLENKIKELEKQKEQYESNASANDSQAAILKQELDKIRDFAGVTKLQGPGIVITLSQKTQGLDEKADSYPVNDWDLLRIVNELNATGAEAISINGQRIVNITQIRGVGTTRININGVYFSNREPFNISAIGNAAQLESGITMPDGIKDELNYYSFKIQKLNNVVINNYNKSYELRYAKPLKDGE
jgi:Uncharacterized protein conserved in bacteria